jgi:hypothetical protein
MGSIYRYKLDNNKKAIELFSKCIKISKDNNGNESLGLAQYLNDIGEAYGA